LPLFPEAHKLVRVDAFEDGTDGFFLALFVRAAGGQAGAGKQTRKKRRQ
jgi:hypothetical protein